jgi:tetratricopeptide (TPR) repeat protein
MVWAGLLLLAAAMTIAANLTVANDLSRSASTVVPGAVLGIILLLRARPLLARWALAMTLAFNLLTPAWHVIRGWDEPSRIYPLHTELERLNRPPALMAGLHIVRASRLARRGQLARALAEVDIAIKINPTSIVALLNRGFLLDKLGRLGDAAACLDAAVRLAPRLPETHRQRGRFRRDHGQLTAAAHDFRAAIDLSPAGSRDRAAIERELAEIRRGPAP